ncbi:MAG: 13E12 repeat family protein, partial [Actinomycetota bacterium]|nr:13E12 repeat family protein [Actinomycetota bacterium]
MSAVASSVISEEKIVDELRAAWAEVSRGYARCWAAMAEVAGRTTNGWESAEIAAALTFTARRADYELGCAQVLVDRLPRLHAALAAGELDHHKARVFTDYLSDRTPAQVDRICERLVPVAPGWTPAQLAARLLREVQAIDPDYTRRTYQRAVRERAVHGYLDHTGTAVLTGSGLPAADAAAAAARLEVLADALRAAGYPATIGQARADLYLRLLDGTLDGLTRQQILATMLCLGPIAPADGDPDAEPSQQRNRVEPDHEAPEREEPGQPVPVERSDQPERTHQPSTGCPGETGTSRPVKSRPARNGIEVRVRLSTLLGVDEHSAELPGWGPLPAAAARDLVA